MAPRTTARGGAKALICPKCRARFDDAAPAPTACPRDGIALVRVRELSENAGDPMLGRTLDGRFTILAKLGAGSMGTVYRARQHAMGRDVAVKILRSDRALDDSAKGRFLREARANSLLASANTVTVFDFGQAASGELYLAMELLEGESLGARLTRVGRLSVTESIDVGRQALRSIAEAHAKGIVHRDLKPDNLFFSKLAGGGKSSEEILKVLDFGIAKLVGESNEVMNAVETQAGMVFGTPRYMSPEQAQGKPLDVRSDLYSLGVILYHALMGRPPFMDDDAVVVMARHIKTIPPPMVEACPDAGVPPEVEALVLRLLAKEPAMRPKSAEALAAELSHLVETGIASTSGVRFSVARSIPQSSMLDGQGAVAPSAQTLALAGVSPRRPVKWVFVGFVTALLVALLAVSFHPTGPAGDSPSASKAVSGTGGGASSSGSSTPYASSALSTPARAGAGNSPSIGDDIPPPPAESAAGIAIPSIPTLSADELPRVSSSPQNFTESPRSGARHAGRGGQGGQGERSSRGGGGPGGTTASASSSAAAHAGSPTAAPAASTGYGYLE